MSARVDRRVGVGRNLLALGKRVPSVGAGAWVADTATVIGSVTLDADASVFYGAVLRADVEDVSVGRGTNVQDNATVHADPGFPVRIGADVSVGHGAVLHGCSIEDGCLIGVNATVMNGAVVGADTLVAAGALVAEGVTIPAGSLVAGVPGRVRRPLTPDEIASLHRNAQTYRDLAGQHRVAEPVSGVDECRGRRAAPTTPIPPLTTERTPC